MMDSRKKFLTTISGIHLGLDLVQDVWEKNVLGTDEVQEFLEEEKCLTLYSSLVEQDDRKKIKFQREIKTINKVERFVVFYKSRPIILNEENYLTAINVTSIQGSAVSSLYHTLNNVFSPLLSSGHKKSNDNSNIERQIQMLQAGLRSSIMLNDSIQDSTIITEHNSLEVILSIDNEIEYWQNVENSTKTMEKRKASASFRDILIPLARDFNVLDAVPLADVEDILEKAHNILDDLWRHDPPYSKNRTARLMELIASDVCNSIEKQLMNINIWNLEYIEASNLLQQCIAVGNRWIKSCKELTEIFWPNYSLHSWSGDPYVPVTLQNLANRLKEVQNVRTIHKQLVRLLTTSEQEDLNTDDMFKPFKEIDILKYGPYMDQPWNSAKKKFEYLLQPAEHRVGVKLRKQLSNVNANTRQLLHEFGRYSELIERPVLKQSLLTERQYLLSVLHDYVRKLSTSMIETPVLSTKYETPQVVSEILTTRQLEAKASDVQSISEKLLTDLQGYNDLKQAVFDLIQDLKQQHTELFDSWTSEIISQINDRTLSLREIDPVVQFTAASKLMKVNYSPRLVTLISEVRQLSALGYRIPNVIEQTSTHAKQFMKYAKTLEQIANFHNTIGDRMLPSQRPMMLASAVELSRLVQDQEVVSWGDVKSVDKYVDNLKAAVDKLSKENKLLQSYNEQILDKINDLEEVDLIKYYQKWRDSAKDMRDIMQQVQQKGFKNMHTWKTEVDGKLCRVLEKQYIKSLDTLHLYLPEIYADLIYRDKHLQFSPEEKTLKEKYEQQLKRFLEIPKGFRGVADNIEANVFTEIIDRCKDQLGKVTKNTENLFEQLKTVSKHWESWLTLDYLDTSKLKTWQNWDLHFRASKTFGQEIAKLPSTEERVGCFIIGLSRLRMDLESHNRSYWDQLTTTLKDSIAEEVVILQEFIDMSTSTLNKPLSFEQIEEVDASHANILQQSPEMEKLYKEMIQKSKTLASWSREKLDSVNRIQAAWERLQSLLDNHQHIISKQIETVKTTLNIASENLNSDIERFSARWDQIKPRPNSGQIATDSLQDLYKHLENIKEKQVQWKELLDVKEKLWSSYKKFGMEPIEYPLCEDIDRDLEIQQNTWGCFEEFYAELDKINNKEWIVFRKKLYLLEEFVHDWQIKLQKMETSPLVTRMMQEVVKYKESIPSLKYLRGEDFTDKHWMEAFSILGIIPKSIDALYLKDFLMVSNVLVDSVSELQVISKKAASEIVVRQALAELDQWDMQAHFILFEHTDSRGVNIMLIKDFKEVLNKIGDNQSLLQSVKNSADYESFSERAGLWETRLLDLDHYLTSLAQIQRKWVYLEPIFGSGTLIQEKSRFDRLDRDYRHLLHFIEKDTRVCALCRYPNLRSLTENLHDQLSRCQHSLDNFLADKRNKFPRFYFLGDDDLLEVVGQSSKEQVIQTHLKKLFAGIHGIKLDEASKCITMICSFEGERVSLIHPVDVSQPVEDWLNVLVKEMQISLKGFLVKCVADGQSADPLNYPSQILCLADSITFTIKTEQAISNMTVPPLLASYKSQLTYYSSLEFGDKSLPSLANSKDEEIDVLELKLRALLLNTIHHISVLEQLLEFNVTKISDWYWQKQLRYYTNSDGYVTVKMVNAKSEYSFEYLGNTPQLVRTPLTDKCFLTLMQGMHLGMGGNPYGPAGTGKTESVKALGGLLGRQVLVFNCDEGIDSVAMGRILSGLVQSGAWGCFDEFNRLDEATLSTISMHIQLIQNAISSQSNTINLLDQEIQVNKHSGIFVTLNPAGGEYGGRNKLPDNLKQLFRPVVMTHPDHEQIATTLLHCDGYQNADIIGRKLIEVFYSASKLLSNQQHYDWGLRALRTVLGGCSNVMKQFRKTASASEGLTLQTELNLVVKAVRMNTLSKLTYVDGEKFDALLKDIFPRVEFENFGNEKLISALEDSCLDLGLKVNKRQITKCVELYEQLKQRMGVALVGPPSSGKTAIRNILFHAMPKLGRILKQHEFNPKSMPRTQLLGQIDMDTRQWTDGVLTHYSLQVTSEPQGVFSWIVCDGDVDPEWVESLNSVLDDNKLLSLPSGCHIQFGPNINFIFETHDLGLASPATISRMGIIFLSEEDLELVDFISNFVNEHSENQSLKQFIDDYFVKAVNWTNNECDLVIPRSKISVAFTALSFLSNVTNKPQFTAALINGLGGQLMQDFREAFAQQVFQWTGDIQPSIFQNFFYNKTRDIVDTYHTNPSQNIDEVGNGLPLIFTGQMNQAIDCLRIWLMPKNEQNFLFIGPHGSAKLLLLKQLVKERNDSEIAIIHCCAHVTPTEVIHKISQHCIIVSSTKGRVYKPKKGHLVLYFKNMHLLRKDNWGTNILIEFLHQMISSKGFFDSSLEWVGIENITIVGSLESTAGISVRFTSILHVFSIDLPQQEDLNIIYVIYLSAILKNMFPNSTVWSKQKISKLTNTVMSIYKQIKSNFNSCEHLHYNFNPHDLTNWCAGLMNYKIENTDPESWIIEILCNEALRIFGDRLTSDVDKSKLQVIINNGVQSDWGKVNILHEISANFYVSSSQCSGTNNLLTKLKFEDWANSLQKGIIQYERDGQKLDVLLIPELLQLSASISRALRMPGGCALLIGHAGVGRRSALRIVSALHSAKLIVPVSVKQPHFNNELKLAMQFSGLEGEQVFLLLQDHILTSDLILNMVNTLISSGEILELYNSPELDSLVSGLKDEASRENFEGSLTQFFTERVRRNLHIIVCLEVDNSSLNKIIEYCPSFHQICTVIWFPEWSTETLEIFPKMLLERANEKNKTETVDSCVWFVEIQNIVDSKLSIPIRYINLIKTYMEIFLEKRKTTSIRQNKLMGGVSKLTEAKNVVAELKVKAAEQQEKLAEKQAKANSALDMISNTMKNANSHKEEMESLKQHTEKENEQLIRRKKEIEIELAEVEPLIQEARSAVGNIKNESLSEIRSLRAPPDIIRDILEGVLRLMGIQDTSWNSMKIFLAKRGVKEDIRSFDASRISSESRQLVERLVKSKPDSFDAKSAKRASVAAAPLAAWVTANVRYSYVLDKIKPLEREQNKLQRNLDTAEMQLGELSAGLLDVDSTVAKLKAQLSTYTKEAAEIEIHLNLAQDTLQTAEGLVEKLNDEYQRWQMQLKELSDDLKKLSLYCLLSAAFITYLSGESEDQRLHFLNEWISKITNNDSYKSFSLEGFLSSEREKLQWHSEGLSTDKLSVQNAIIILKSEITTLLIDPTSAASNWIKTHLKRKNIEIITQNNAKFNTTLELAVRFGKVLIVEEAEDITPNIYPILRKEFIHQGERKLVSLNGKMVDYHDDFFLIFCSRNENLKLPADICAFINTVNFTITHAGLCEQLLNSAIKQESPQLEERRKQLSRDREEMQEKQYTLQNQLLEDLANSTGDILQNKNLMMSLNETKASSNAISKALEESQQIQLKLQQEYDIYREISLHGSLLYFAANEYSKLNILYSLSVAAYTRLFLRSLPSAEENKQTFTDSRRFLIQALYQLMGRGIFKSDQIKFVIHLVHKMFPDEILNEEWKLFLGQVVIGNKTDLRENVPSWLPEITLQSIYLLQISLPNVYKSLQLNEHVSWKHFMEAKTCEVEFPTHCKLTEFQKVLVVQALRPDRLYSALYSCALHLTGLKTLNLEVLQLSKVLKETIPKEPIFLITSGNDPSSEIKDLAKTKVGLENYTEIPMGEGQEEKALQALEDASKLGQWLTLKNIHLVTSWLPILSQNLQNLDCHENFRLWLVTEPHSHISPVLAQNCLKIAYETPQGIKNNLKRSFTSWGSDYIQKLNPNSARLFFVLATIHAILQERRNYIPQGWLKWYEFSDVDLTSIIRLSEEIWQTPSTQVPWQFIISLCLEAIYGGRIENMQDLAILNTYLHQYLNDEVLSHRWKPLGLVNALPTSAKFQEYINAIQQLSNRDLPAYFRLPENLDRAWEKNLSSDIISLLKDLEVYRSISSTNQENYQRGLLPFLTLWKKLNQGQEFIRVNVPTAAKSGSPILIFMSEEYRNAIILLQKIHKCFAMLNRLAKGIANANGQDLSIATSLISLQTPKQWLKLWLGPKDPSLYLRNIMNKTLHISKWSKDKNIESFLKVPINLSYLFRPETFLQAVKQDFSRKCNIPMDELSLKTEWKSSAQSAIILAGLFIEGALFDGNIISPCLSNSENMNPVPNCYLSFISMKNPIEVKLFDVPLYFTSNREKQLISLQVPTTIKEKDLWVQAGLAFFLSY